jgi:hypothetical protein
LAQSYCFIRRFLLSPAAQAGLFLSLRWPSLARCWSPPEVPQFGTFSVPVICARRLK